MDDLQRAQFHPARHGLVGIWPVLLICALAAITAIWLLSPMTFIFGTGGLALLMPSLLLFGVILLFKRLIFKRIYTNTLDDEAVLLEYFSQQNAQQNGDQADEDQAVELLENALHLRERTAADCMAKRTDIVHIDFAASVSDLRHLFSETQLSRIIVTEQGLDQVKGYVHVQQLFAQPGPESIADLVLPIELIPAEMPANILINHLIRQQTNIACVVNDQQHVIGIITLEDALEQLFGDIDDEHDG